MRVVKVLAFIGLAISGCLLVMKLTGSITSIRGCGGSGGCENVLGSKWSQWFGIPVSAFSTLLYGGLIALTFKATPSQNILKAIAVLLILAAVWFVGLQIFAIKSFCPWCCATHVVGILTAIFILKEISGEQKEHSSWPATFAGIALFLGMVLGQILGPEPETHEVVENKAFAEANKETLPPPPPPSKEGKKSPQSDRVISFQGGAKKFRVAEFPLIGSPEAKHILVKYFDYTCASCRDAEGDLAKLMEKYPDEVAVIVLPTPINSQCNPYLVPGMPDHKHACELAQLGLAVWKAAPDQFEEAHQILFSRPVVDFEAARERLIKFVPKDKLDTALKDPWIQRTLNSNYEDFRLLTKNSPMMPKLLIGESRLMQGVARTTEKFVANMEKLLELQ